MKLMKMSFLCTLYKSGEHPMIAWSTCLFMYIPSFIDIKVIISKVKVIIVISVKSLCPINNIKSNPRLLLG